MKKLEELKDNIEFWLIDQPKTAYFSIPDQNVISFHKKKVYFTQRRTVDYQLEHLQAEYLPIFICPISTIMLNMI